MARPKQQVRNNLRTIFMDNILDEAEYNLPMMMNHWLDINNFSSDFRVTLWDHFNETRKRNSFSPDG